MFYRELTNIWFSEDSIKDMTDDEFFDYCFEAITEEIDEIETYGINNEGVTFDVRINGKENDWDNYFMAVGDIETAEDLLNALYVSTTEFSVDKNMGIFSKYIGNGEDDMPNSYEEMLEYFNYKNDVIFDTFDLVRYLCQYRGIEPRY